MEDSGSAGSLLSNSRKLEMLICRGNYSSVNINLANIDLIKQPTEYLSVLTGSQELPGRAAGERVL